MNLEPKELRTLKDAIINTMVLKKDGLQSIEASKKELEDLYCKVCNEFDEVKQEN